MWLQGSSDKKEPSILVDYKLHVRQHNEETAAGANATLTALAGVRIEGVRAARNTAVVTPGTTKLQGSVSALGPPAPPESTRRGTPDLRDRKAADCA